MTCAQHNLTEVEHEVQVALLFAVVLGGTSVERMRMYSDARNCILVHELQAMRIGSISYLQKSVKSACLLHENPMVTLDMSIEIFIQGAR